MDDRMNGKFDVRKLNALKSQYLAAKTAVDDVKAKDWKIREEVLKEYPFYESEETVELYRRRNVDHKRERIFNPNHDYTMNEHDMERYIDLLYERYKEAGIDDYRGRGYCPDAVPNERLSEAEKTLAEYAIEIIADGVAEKNRLKEAVSSYKWREKVIQIAMKF